LRRARADDLQLNNEANYHNGLILRRHDRFLWSRSSQPVRTFGGGHVSIALANARNGQVRHGSSTTANRANATLPDGAEITQL